MPWIESHTILIRHRKLLLLAQDLGIKPVQAMGHLHALWHSALEQQIDGDLSNWNDEMIAQMAHFEGDSKAFVSGLEKHGWTEQKLLHDWLDYAGLYLVRKYSTSNIAMLKAIWKRHGRVYGQKAYKANKQRTNSEQKANSTLPNHTIPNLTKEQWLIFWEKYPRKVAKKKAEKAWNGIALKDGLFEKIISALEGAKKSEQWLKNEGKYIPHPTTWLNEERWNDELKPVGVGGSGRNGSRPFPKDV